MIVMEHFTVIKCPFSFLNKRNIPRAVINPSNRPTRRPISPGGRRRPTLSPYPPTPTSSSLPPLFACQKGIAAGPKGAPVERHTTTTPPSKSEPDGPYPEGPLRADLREFLSIIKLKHPLLGGRRGFAIIRYWTLKMNINRGKNKL